MKEEKLINIQHSKKGQKILFDQYYDHMYALAHRYLKIKEDAEDALSEAFTRVFRHIESFTFRGEGSLRKWIKTIVINEALRIINSKQGLVFSEEISDTDLDFSEELDNNIDTEYFLKVVDSLPNGYRLVFMMYVVEEYSHKEIAEKLNISISTSKSQLFKARSLIVKKLNKIEAHEAI